jgi:hypothetical protein
VFPYIIVLQYVNIFLKLLKTYFYLASIRIENTVLLGYVTWLKTDQLFLNRKD